MLSLLKKIFRKTEATPLAPAPQVATGVSARPAAAAPESMQSMPHVEVAHLSLAAILGKLPPDLKSNVAQTPDGAVTVALPLATIHKQLPSGSVKMSLASLYRQAPAGTFRQSRVEDKRMIEIPLNEVLRHVNPQMLRRRPEQRRADLPKGGVALFGDKSNPYAIAPAELEEEAAEPAVVDLSDAVVQEAQTATVAEPAFGSSDPVPEPQRVIKPTFNFAAPAVDAAPAPAARALNPAPASNAPRIASPVAKEPATKVAAPAAAPIATDSEPALLLPIADLATNWPEPIRSEALALNGTKVALPAAAVTAGLARGKITFTWAQVRAWLTPPPVTPTQAREGTELVLPLKIVAPAFLKQKRPATSRKAAVQVDEAIPALFSGAQPLAETAEVQVAEPLAIEVPPAAPIPPITPPVTLAEPAPEPAAAATSAEVAPQTPGELFGQPEKTHWSPQDLIKAAVRLPGVAGAIVALHEGLIVASELPESLKGETVAAFLPQMFARLNAYASEMKLGGIEDLLFTTAGAHFQAYRIGEVYFAVLGKPGESLPWENLRVVAAELARHTNP